MSWNYRLVKYTDKTAGYGIHEVYYDKHGNVEYWTEDAVELNFDTPEEIILTLELMKKSVVGKPTLHEERLPG